MATTGRTGYFSFAFGYDLTKDSGVYSAADKTTIESWFRRIADVMKGYQDNWATKVRTGRGAYDWSPNYGLTFDRHDFDVGRDTSACPAAAWLAAALVSNYTAHLNLLYSSSYTLSIPKIIDAATNPDNDGDNRGTRPVPQVQVQAGIQRAGNLAYMSYNARVIAMLYEMTANSGRATTAQRDSLHRSFTYLSKFAGPNYMSPIAPGDTMPWGDFLTRMQQAVHLYGDAAFVADVTGGQASRSSFYDIQYIGPTVLTQP